MTERIVRNKRVSRCSYCGREITTEYKVKKKWGEGRRNSKFYHLSCRHKDISGDIITFKNSLSELYKLKRKFKKYGKQMILEGLGDL